MIYPDRFDLHPGMDTRPGRGGSICQDIQQISTVEKTIGLASKPSQIKTRDGATRHRIGRHNGLRPQRQMVGFFGKTKGRQYRCPVRCYLQPGPDFAQFRGLFIDIN